MFYGPAYTNSPLCKYFRKAVLPTDPRLEAIFNGGENDDNTGGTLNSEALKKCSVCGKPFYPTGRSLFCSDACRAKSKRIQDRDSKRRQRRDKG